MDGSTLDLTHPPSRQQAAVGGSGASSQATHAPSAKLWNQVSVHRTLRPLLGPPWARSLRYTSLPYCGYVGSTDSEMGNLVAPTSKPLETSCLVPGWDAEVLGDLPQEVVDTITSVGAPSPRHAYALRWKLFVEWCSSYREDPRKCPIRVVLSVLQQVLERILSPSTLKVYVAAIAAHGREVGGEA